MPDPNPARQDGSTPIYAAAAAGHLQVVQYLASVLDDLMILDWPTLPNDGAAPIHAAAQQGFLEVVKFLVDYTNDPNARLHDGTTPIYLAAQKGNCNYF